MKVIVFGASGHVGRLLVQELLDRGHTVTAFVRNDLDIEHPHLGVLHGDIYDVQAATKAVMGADVVMSALGSWGTPRKDVLTTAMRTIVPAMEQNGQRRIVSLTGSAAHLPGEKLPIWAKFDRLMLKMIDRKVLADGEAHLALLAASSLDWTVIRSPIMNDRGDATRYSLKTAFTLPFTTVHRKSVALAMVDVVEQGTWLQQAPCIHRK